MEQFAVRDLTFSYPETDRRALERVTFSVRRGDFVAVCGATGSGKTTLLRLLKRQLAPLGERGGEILYNGVPLEELDEYESACRIGFVMQRPEQQLVTDRVWHELAFGLENMRLPQNVIRRRVAEMASYFGIEDWFDRPVSELSGGQKQLLNLASVMVMQPDVLLLDEPTAQLDPIAASDFIATLRKLNRELSLTVLIIEHRLEEVVPVADRLLVLEQGRVLDYDPPREVAGRLRGHPALVEGMPAAVRLFNRFALDTPCPLTVREGRRFVEERFKNDVRALPDTPADTPASDTPALEFREAYFRYERGLPDVLRGLELTVNEGELFCVLGGNGSGKSTALAAAAGLRKLYAGDIRVFGRRLREYKGQSLYQNCLALLPQDVQTLFVRNTVREELSEAGSLPDTLPYDLTPLLGQHPYDLSGGEQQLVALAKVLATHPRLLLLDEPTKGLDAHARQGITRILRALRDRGVTVVIVTHDVEFAAACADRCALFFRGEILSCDPPRRFFAENSFYTTAANRMTRGYYDNVATVDDAETLCRANGPRSSTAFPSAGGKEEAGV